MTRSPRGQARAGKPAVRLTLIVVSDRAARGERADQTAEPLRPALTEAGFDLGPVRIGAARQNILANPGEFSSRGRTRCMGQEHRPASREAESELESNPINTAFALLFERVRTGPSSSVTCRSRGREF